MYLLGAGNQRLFFITYWVIRDSWKSVTWTFDIPKSSSCLWLWHFHKILRVTHVVFGATTDGPSICQCTFNNKTTDSIDKNLVFYRVVKTKLDTFPYLDDTWNGEALSFIRFCISWSDGCPSYAVRTIASITPLLWSVITSEVLSERW